MTRTSGAERVVPFGAKGTNAERAVTLTDAERRILLVELAKITAELDELRSRAEEIAQRVTDAEALARLPWQGAA